MFGLGFPELVALAVLGLILLGPEQLPEVARTLGRFINDLKKSTEDLTDEFKKHGFDQQTLDEMRKDMLPPAPPVTDKDFENPHHVHDNKEETKTDGKKPESN